MGAIAQQVIALLGEAQVKSWAALDAHWRGRIQSAIAVDHRPDAIVYPETPEHLAAVVACAYENQWRVLPCGHGSKLSWGGLLAGADLVISTQRLSTLVEHAVGDLTVTLQAGMPFAELQAALLATRQFLPSDPAYPQTATLGGIVATRDTGALRQRYGGIRDLLIGVSFVRHDGQIAKAGGRVVKNVAGYDLMKLMTGSFGTLGILTELTFRTYPLQEASQTVLLRGDAEAIQNIAAAIRLSPLTPVAMDILSPGLLDEGDSVSYGLALQFQTIHAGVTEQVERLLGIAAPHPLEPQVLTADADAHFWQAITAQLFPEEHPADTAIAQFGLLPAQGISLLANLDTLLQPGSWQARIHASSGIGTLRLASDRNSPDGLATVRSRCQASGGYLTLLEAPKDWKTHLDPWALPASTQLLMGRLREQFDPQKRLSPGRFGK